MKGAAEEAQRAAEARVAEAHKREQEQVAAARAKALGDVQAVQAAATAAATTEREKIAAERAAAEARERLLKEQRREAQARLAAIAPDMAQIETVQLKEELKQRQVPCSKASS